MLRLRSLPFTLGRSTFLDHVPGAVENRAKVYVKVKFPGIERAVFAQLDTGAAWSVLPPDLVIKSNLSLESGDPAVMQTWLGRRVGRLVRMQFTLAADEGEDLSKEGTFFVTPDWPEGMTFLGYSALLDSIRFALDPQVNDFFFGPC